MKPWFTKIRQSAGLFDIAVLGAGNVSGTLISAIALILFSRYLGPTEFGIFSAAFAAMQISIRLADMGLNIAAERSISRMYKTNRDAADKTMRITLWLKTAMTVVVVLLSWAAAPWFAESVLHITDVNLIRAASVLSVGTIFFEYTTLIFQATEKFTLVARITLAQALAKLIVGLVLIWQKMLTPVSALVVYGIMPLVGSLAAWFPSPMRDVTLPHAWKKELKGIVKVAKWTAVAAIAATLADNIDVLMVQSLLSAYDTGLWSAAARIAAFASVVGWSIGSVLNNRVAKYRDKAHLDEYLQKAWKLAIASFILIVITIPFSHLAIWFTVGREYLPAVPALQIILIASALTAATSPFVALFYLFDKPQYYAQVGLLQTILLLGGDYFLIPSIGLMGAAYVRVGVRIFVLLFTLAVARRTYREQYGRS